MSIKRFFLILTTLLSAIMLPARQLSPAEALGRLQTMSASKGMTVSPIIAYQLAYSSMKNGNTTYYAFNKAVNGGFVVLSADDCMPAVLMESDNNAIFDIDSIPDGMRYWLNEYDKVISQYAAEGKTYTTSLTNYDEIAPLLEMNGKCTAWNQDEPYNNLCPQYEGHKGLTGCVATATAQIMRYHEWPKSGTGSKTYDYEFEYVHNDKKDTTYIDMSATSDFSSHTYDWANMLDTYDGVTSTDVEKNAVAQLMYDVGVAAEMYYGNYGSGTDNVYAVAGLVDHLGYDASAVIYPRSLYTDAQWEEMVYRELSQGRPILYSGIDKKEGGHAFVCDGYKDGRYHMNWGWGGQCNCYVLMTSSSQTEPAISAVEKDGSIYASFNIDQSAILNIMPDQGGSLSKDMKMVSQGEYTTCTYNSQTNKLDSKFTFARTDYMFVSGGFYSMCYMPRYYALGIKASNADHTYYMTAGKDTLVTYSGYAAYGVDLTDILTPGTYTITPVYKDLSAGDTEWHEMAMRSDITKPTITISNFTTSTQPYMQITEMPVISTNNGTTTTSDNQVLKINGSVDLGISVKANILNPTSVSFYVSRSSYSDYHTLNSYIYDYETGKFRAVMYCTSEETSAGKTVTLYPTTRYKGVNVDDSLEVGHQYIMEFVDTFRPIASGAHYNTTNSVPNYTSQFIPNTEYQDIVFKVVDNITTGVESVVAKEPEKNTPTAKKILQNGKLIIFKGNKRYSVSGQQLD